MTDKPAIRFANDPTCSKCGALVPGGAGNVCRDCGTLFDPPELAELDPENERDRKTLFEAIDVRDDAIRDLLDEAAKYDQAVVELERRIQTLEAENKSLHDAIARESSEAAPVEPATAAAVRGKVELPEPPGSGTQHERD